MAMSMLLYAYTTIYWTLSRGGPMNSCLSGYPFICLYVCLQLTFLLNLFSSFILKFFTAIETRK